MIRKQLYETPEMEVVRIRMEKSLLNNFSGGEGSASAPAMDNDTETFGGGWD